MVYCSHHLACNSVLENVSFNFDKLICLRMKDPIRSTRHCSRVLQMLIWSSSVVGFLCSDWYIFELLLSSNVRWEYQNPFCRSLLSCWSSRPSSRHTFRASGEQDDRCGEALFSVTFPFLQTIHRWTTRDDELVCCHCQDYHTKDHCLVCSSTVYGEVDTNNAERTATAGSWKRSTWHNVSIPNGYNWEAV
jgi:hypothetical protein